MKEYHQPTPKPDCTSDPNCPFDTWVFPLVQMGQLGIDLDHLATTRLLHELPERSKVRLASGYFNLTDDYVHDVVFHSQSELDVLTASPEVFVIGSPLICLPNMILGVETCAEIKLSQREDKKKKELMFIERKRTSIAIHRLT